MKTRKLTDVNELRESENGKCCISSVCENCSSVCKWKQLRTGSTCDGCEYYHRVYGPQFSDIKYCHNKSVPLNCKLYDKSLINKD